MILGTRAVVAGFADESPDIFVRVKCFVYAKPLILLEASPGIEPGCKDLQSSA